MTREEANRKLAVWIGFKRDGDDYWHHPLCTETFVSCQCGDWLLDGPDFYTDETASAMLKRKIRERIPYMVMHREGPEEVVRFVPKVDPIIEGKGATELEAIVDAALVYIAAQEAVRP